MPIPTIKNGDKYEAPVKQDPITIQPLEYKGVTVDTTMMERDILTTYISGQAWDVDYYSQIKGSSDAIQNFQIDLPAAYQQYRLIRGLELKVDDPLSENQDSQTKDMTISGSAKVYGVFVPNTGDVFIADIGDGREGLITVTSSKRLSHYESTPYAIEYVVTQLMTKDIRDALDTKVQETLFFNKDFLVQGLEPLLHGEDVDIVSKLTSHYNRLLALYFNDFYSRTLKSLLVPNQPEITYDPFLVKFIKTILSTDEHPAIRNMVEFNVSEDQSSYEYTLWNCLATLDYSLLPMCVHEAGIMDINNFYSMPLFNSIYYSGVQQVVYPDMAETNVDAGYVANSAKALSKIRRGRARFREMNRLVANSLSMDPTYEIYEALDHKSPAIRRVTHDDYYVLSKDFYLNDGTQILSKLEVLTLAALKGEAIDIRMLEKLCEGSKYWDNVERFYYFPILFVLLRVYPRRIK